MDMYNAVLEIGKRKLAAGMAQEDAPIQGPRIGTGGVFDGVFLWDTAFSVFWMRYHQDIFPCTRSLDNLYRLQQENGCIHREYTADGKNVWPDYHPITFAPPVLTWAELALYEVNQDVQRLKQVYPHLKRHYQWAKQHFQQDDGLYIGDSLGSGMDNLPRYPRDYQGDDEGIPLPLEDIHPNVHKWFIEEFQGQLYMQWNQQGRLVDLSSQVAFNAKCLAELCAIIEDDDQAWFRNEYEQLKECINAQCWNEQHNFYFDLGFGEQIERFHIGGFWPLLAEIVPEEKLDAYLSHLQDPKKFNRLVPVPSLAADDPDYETAGGYWRGSSWPCTTYMVLRALRTNGREDMALDLARRYAHAIEEIFNETETIWENLAPDACAPGSRAYPEFCGWGGLGVVALKHEFFS